MLCITFDNFGAAAEYGHGQGMLPPQMRPPSVPVSEWERYNWIGLELGQPRMLGVLKELGIRTTFYTEGYAAVMHPVEVKRWADDGHEIALHGWKHEIWTSMGTKEREDRLLNLSMAAMTEVLGKKAPVGFRGPGFKLNPWSEELLAKYGIKYVSQVGARSQAFTDRFDKLGIKYSDEGNDIKLTRLKWSPVSDELTDAFLVQPSHGGLFGQHDADKAYDIAYESAVAHETKMPNEPWVFVAHPMISGNRAWTGFDKFVRRLHEKFGSGVFKTTAEVALGNEVALAN